MIHSRSGCLCWLRRARPTWGAVLLQPLTPAPDLNRWAITDRLLNGLAFLNSRVGLLRAGRPAVGGVRSRWFSHGPSAWAGRSANIPAGRGANRLPLESRHVESAQDTGQLQTDIVAPGAFMVQIRRPATDEDRQQERPQNRC